MASKRVISIIDDDASVREATARLVRSLGHAAAVFSSAEEYLESAQGRDSACLISDLHMPGMSGTELAEVLRARDAGLKVLFLSGHSRDTVVRHGVMHPEVAFLQKPFTLDALSKELREVFASD